MKVGDLIALVVVGAPPHPGGVRSIAMSRVIEPNRTLLPNLVPVRWWCYARKTWFPSQFRLDLEGVTWARWGTEAHVALEAVLALS